VPPGWQALAARGSISLESRALSREGLWVKPDSGKRGP